MLTYPCTIWIPFEVVPRLCPRPTARLRKTISKETRIGIPVAAHVCERQYFESYIIVPTRSALNLHRLISPLVLVYDVALEIIGGSQHQSIISCINGQVICPTVLETEVPMTDGFLHLYCFPGHVLWEGNIFDRIQSRDDFRSVDSRDVIAPGDVIPLDSAIPEDLNLENAELQRVVTVDDECLQVASRLHYLGCTITQTCNQWCIITAHASIFRTICRHEWSDCYRPFLALLSRVVHLSLLPRAPGIQQWNVAPRELHYRDWLCFSKPDQIN
jgi:hypothetical protein